MRLDKLTTKFQEALGEAQSLALGKDHAYIEPAHLLLAMLRQADGPKSLLQRAGVNVPGLTKATEDRAHVYRPAKPRQQVIGGMVRDFLDRVFDGASDPLLVHLARDNKLTPKQRRLVKQLLDEKDGEQ